MSGASHIPDLLDVEVPVGGRIMVVADLHLTPEPTPPQLGASGELAAAIEAATGPGVLVLAGNLFDSDPDPRATLAAHARLATAVSDYASGAGRRVVLLPGDRDVRLSWWEPGQAMVREGLGAELALSVDLVVATGAGTRKVRVDPGQRFDPRSAFRDPRNPLESPFVQHVRHEVLPAVRLRAGRRSGWLAGMEQLDSPASVSRFVASRLVYRRLVRFIWLLLVPVIAAVALRLPATALRSARAGGLTTRLGLFVLAAVVELLLLVALSVLAIRVTNRALGAVSLDDPGTDPNDGPRAAARELVTAGYAGLITGQTCRAELTHLGVGFYANAGTGAEVVTEHPSRVPGLGLPSVFLSHRSLSWVEVEAGNDLHVRLLHARQDLPGSGLVERLVADRPVPDRLASDRLASDRLAGGPGGLRRAPGTGDLRPAVVATFPQGPTWPRPPSRERQHRRVRRVAATLIMAVAFFSLVSAMSDPLRDRLDVLRSLFPLVVPQTAAAVVAFFGVGLLVVARGIRRGQRRAWMLCESILLAVAVLHLVKGVDVEDTAVAAIAAGILWLYRGSFQARTDVVALGRGILSVAVAAVLTLAAGTVAVEFSIAINHGAYRAARPGGTRGVSWWHAFEAAANRMVGSSGVVIPHRIDEFLTPTMEAAAAALILALVMVLFRPVVSRHRGGRVAGRDGFDVERGHAGLVRARAVLARHGSGTLDYFALRPDKDFFFWGDTVVAHAVYGGVCLVSPDPVGPVAEREEAWRAFRRYVDSHGWALGGLGIGEEWLPIYRATGMHDLYVGDEAVVRVDRFTLEGGRFKGLRQAVNRIAKYGYRISFHDPARLEPELCEALRSVMTKSRRGDVERGFSMTLGRVFDAADSGLLLAVVHGPAGGSTVGSAPGSADGSAAPGGPAAPDGRLGPPVAFCQYVPAPGIGGYSLDLMRRDDGEHPNGLIDFAVVETIKELKTRGHQGLGLNFATMRAVLAGEAGEGLTQRVQAWMLRRMGDSMQIESLWKFNAKFDPDWQPRYAVYDAPENMLAVAIAVARAESFWELPVIGRFLVPAGPVTSDPGT